MEQRNEKDKMKLVKENINEGLNKRVIKLLIDDEGLPVKVCAVNGAYVKSDMNFIEFIEGGHHSVDSAPGYNKIPKDEIWVDDVFLKNKVDWDGIVLHEFSERNLMLYKGWSYDKAHEEANKIEKAYRKRKQK